MQKNIRYWMRNISFYVDGYLRHLIERVAKINYQLDIGVDNVFNKFNLSKNSSLLNRENWSNNYATSEEGFSLIIESELERGCYLDKIQKDFSQLKLFIKNYQQYLVNILLKQGQSSQKINELFLYLLKTVSEKQPGGKRGVVKTRPVVFERVYSAFGSDIINGKEDGYESQAFFRYRIGTILEIYNRATYAIDDVMDKSEYRGGLPTLHKVFNDKQAIIAGQWLHLFSLELLLDELDNSNLSQGNDWRVLESLNIIHKSIYLKEVENYDLQKKICDDYEYRIERFKKPIKDLTDYYLKRVDLRTGKFYEYICKIAVLFATNDNKTADGFKKYGQSLGMRYLIDNDLKDLIDPYFIKSGTPSRGLKGKEHVSFCGDLEIGKVTYPIFVALKNNFDENIVKLIGKNLTYEEKNKITSFVIKNRGIKETLKLLKNITDEAREVLKEFKIKDKSLWELVDLYKYSAIPFDKFKEYYKL